MRTATAALQLAQGNPQAAADVLAPVLDGSVSGARRPPMMTALLQEAAARNALGDRAAGGHAMERALDIADATGILLPFLLDPAPTLLEQHLRCRTTHAALAARILNLLAPRGTDGPGEPERPSEAGGPREADGSPPRGAEGVWGERFPPKSRGGLGGIVPPGQHGLGGIAPPGLIEPLTASETYILRFLPTRLTAQEIASESSLSVHTVTTHMRHLYAKLGVHRRRQAVERARGLGLLAPTPLGPLRRTG
jgi:LuxR family transcriptional regulator, maltose regulon positive regulatory protein